MMYWVFGASCSGKKHFIKVAVDHPDWFGLPELCPIWIRDGDMTAEELAAYPDLNLIVRWQWNRENVLLDILNRWPAIKHHIFMCMVLPSVQVARVIQREGSLIWAEEALIQEQAEVKRLVEKLSIDHRIPVTFINTTKEYACPSLKTIESPSTSSPEQPSSSPVMASSPEPTSTPKSSP